MKAKEEMKGSSDDRPITPSTIRRENESLGGVGGEMATSDMSNGWDHLLVGCSVDFGLSV